MDKLSRGHLEAMIEKVSYLSKGKRTRCTLVVMGIELTGDSFCAFSQPMNKAVGEKVAYENALASLRSHELYAQRKSAS